MNDRFEPVLEQSENLRIRPHSRHLVEMTHGAEAAGAQRHAGQHGQQDAPCLGANNAIWSSCSSQVSNGKSFYWVALAAMAAMSPASVLLHADRRDAGHAATSDCTWNARASASASFSQACSAARRTLSTLPRACG